jgi:hypothetical protein
MADCLGMPVKWFIDNLDDNVEKDKTQADLTYGANILLQREVQELLRAYFGISEVGERRFLRRVMTLMATSRH